MSFATICKQLGHRNLQTTLRYAEQLDTVADVEIRTWGRRAGQSPKRNPQQPTKER